MLRLQAGHLMATELLVSLMAVGETEHVRWPVTDTRSIDDFVQFTHSILSGNGLHHYTHTVPSRELHLDSRSQAENLNPASILCLPPLRRSRHLYA